MSSTPIIIKKVKKVSGDGHHGGAWKVAYADFVTAMMAFFLLMWLLNATSEEQRKGLADFFDPSLPVSKTSAGGSGMLGGEDVFVQPLTAGTRAEGVRPKPTHQERGEDLGDLDASPDLPMGETTPNTMPPPPPGEAEEQSEVDAQVPADPLADAGGTGLEGMAEDLLEEMRAAGGDGLLEHFSMRMTPEGLLIEIVDLSGDPLFETGSAAPAPIMTTLIDILVPVLGSTTNDIAVSGHTDATPFSTREGYSNWELSADRANAARRLMTTRGLTEGRIVRVSGHAATSPISDDPLEARNRRIAITILRNEG